MVSWIFGHSSDRADRDGSAEITRTPGRPPGLIVVLLVDDLRVLECAGLTNHDLLDTIVSALVVGAGTEASNTVQKLLSYSKDKLK